MPYLFILILILAPFSWGFEVLEIQPRFAAEVYGANLRALTDEEFNHLNNYLWHYKVLVFRNQSTLTVEDQRVFTSKFGPLHSHLESTSHHPDYHDVNVISNIKNTSGGVTGLYGDHVENFHSDLSWTYLPTKVTFLKSDILPEEGGDTHYADSTQAYYSLSHEFRSRITGLQGHYSYLKFRDDVPGLSEEEMETIRRGQNHPLIITHPVTGAKNIYANPAHTKYVVGVSNDESEAILRILFETVAQPQFQYIHKWRPGDAVMWDNRAMQHRATPSPNSPRRLIRTTVLNDDIPREEIDNLPLASQIHIADSASHHLNAEL